MADLSTKAGSTRCYKLLQSLTLDCSSHRVAVSRTTERPMSSVEVRIGTCFARSRYFCPSQRDASNDCGKIWEARVFVC